MLSDVDRDIINCMWECDLNVKDVAKHTNYSKSAIYNHLDSIRRKTGLDPKKVRDIVELRKLI